MKSIKSKIIDSVTFFINHLNRNTIIAIAAVLAIIVVDIIFLSVQTKRINARADEKIAAAEQQYSAMLAAATASAQSAESPAHQNADAEYIAKVVAGCATYSSEKVQRAVAWCVLNRVDSPLYPATIQEVCEQPSQWQGYEDAPVIDSICLLCEDVINTWQSGGKRDIPQDCVFLRMTEKGVELRTEFKGGNVWKVE